MYLVPCELSLSSLLQMQLEQLPNPLGCPCSIHCSPRPHSQHSSPTMGPLPGCYPQTTLCLPGKPGFCSRFIDSIKPPQTIPMEVLHIHEAEALIF